MSADSNGSIMSAVALIAQAESPREAARELLRCCIQVAGARRGRIYIFDRSSGNFISFVSIGRSKSSTPVRYPQSSQLSTVPYMLERAILGQVPVWSADPVRHADDRGFTGTYQSRLVVPVIRGRGTCVALLDIDADNVGQFGEHTTQMIVALQPMIALMIQIYGWEFRRTLVEQILEPIGFDEAENEFFNELGDQIALASQAEFFVLREYDEKADRLLTLKQFGLQAREAEDELDLGDVRDIPPFYRVIKKRAPVPAPNMRGQEFAALRRMHAIDVVRSFVACPVLVGTELFGVLSFGSSVEYEYDYDEISGLQSVANGVGLSILNFRHFHQAKHEVAQFSNIGAAITAVEVAQAVRHEALGTLADASAKILIAQKALSSRQINSELALEQLSRLGEWTEELSGILDKIKSASKLPQKERRILTISEIWTQAKTQLSGRIAVAGVRRVDRRGPDAKVEVAPDWFRQVFINLILNSCDAFISGSTAKNGRAIQLTVDPADGKANSVRMRYSDNAGGINFSRLRRTDGERIDEVPEQAIFAPDVTSKRDGSGWGLALCRRILAQHGGSIDLLEHRNRTVFELELPRPSR